MLKTVLILQARMGSTRLPGKVLREIMGKPLIEYEIERLKRVARAQEVWIATSIMPADDLIEAWALVNEVSVFRGSESDVLDRYYHAAQKARADVIVRLTADCPLIDPQVIDKMLEVFAEGKWDYVSNSVERTFPRGLDAEVFSFATLEAAFKEAKSPDEREHVTRYIYRYPQKFRIAQVKHSQDLSENRWTVDTEEDFELIQRILKELYPQRPRFLMADVLDVLQKHPDWSAINSHVMQKH